MHDHPSAVLSGGEDPGLPDGQQAGVLPGPPGDLRDAGGGGGEPQVQDQHQAGVRGETERAVRDHGNTNHGSDLGSALESRIILLLSVLTEAEGEEVL